VASRNCAWAIEGGESYMTIYIPTSPNPTTGVVLMVKESETTKVDMTPDQALTWVVSTGVAVPQPHSPTNGAAEGRVGA
jgi:uncharacterized membrane protein